MLQALMVAGAAYMAYRFIAWRRRVSVKLAEVDSLATARPTGHEPGGPGVSRFSQHPHDLPWFAPVLDVSWMGWAEWSQLQAIDPKVIEAADFWLKDDIADLGAFRHVVAEAAEHPHYDSWFHALKGYVGEQVAVDVLERSGVQVELAPSPNQAGWDLWVDGQPYNVKVGESASLIRDHFQRYPDIDVITGPDLAAQVPEYADHILVLPELSNAAVEHLTESTIAEALQLGWDVQVPVVTALLSSLREAHLLFRGETDAATGLRNVALDVVGTGGGMAAGGKLGATIGTALAPGPGTVMGGLLLALAGALAGRCLTNRIKQRALRDAIQRFQRAQEETRREWEQRQAELRERLLAHLERTESELREQLAEIERRHRAVVWEGKAAYREQVQAFLEEVPRALHRAGQHLAQREREVLASMPRSPWIRRLIWPTERDVEWRAAQIWFQRQRQLLRRKAHEAALIVQGMKDASLPAEEAFERVRGLLADLPLVHTHLATALETLHIHHRRTLELIALEQRLTAREAQNAALEKARELQSFMIGELEALGRWAQEGRQRLEELLENVKREARKLGIHAAGTGE